MVPMTGHTINLEEPGKFNAALEDFLHAVERGGWGGRAPARGGSYVLVPKNK
jgi:hypothetical protein